MKENTILANVHMLATDKASNLMIDSNGKLRYSGSFGFDLFDENNNHQHTNKQFLYFTTDEEIKEGDKVFRVNPDDKLVDGEILSATKVMIATQSHKGFTKIVATTNPELWNITTDLIRIGAKSLRTDINIAKILTTFLQSYVDSYYSGRKIEQVRLEIEYSERKNIGGIETYNSMITQLKLNSDGSVVIHPIDNEIMMGVGDGTGNLFVKGDYESIKVLQTKLLEKRYTREEMEEIHLAIIKAGCLEYWNSEHERIVREQFNNYFK